jgi:GNAT superfamily N-acetyltransferase
MWKRKGTRTNPAEVERLLRAHSLILAEIDGVLVGSVNVNLKSDGVGEFGMLVADRKYRGKGIGSALVEHAERWARENACDTMRLEVLTPRHWTHPSKDFSEAVVRQEWVRATNYRTVRIDVPGLSVRTGNGVRFPRMRKVPLRRLLGEPLAAYGRAEYTEYHEMLETIFAAFEIRPEIAVECDATISLLAAVESGRGVAIVPEVFHGLAGSRVKLRPIEPTLLPMMAVFAYPREKVQSRGRHLRGH